MKMTEAMYREMYMQLFHAATRALEDLRQKQYADAELVLLNAQREAEQTFIQWPELSKAFKK